MTDLLAEPVPMWCNYTGQPPGIVDPFGGPPPPQPTYPSGLQVHVHHQVSPSHYWLINHNYGRYAAGIHIIGTDGRELRAAVTQPDVNQVIVAHDRPQAGTAFLIL